MENLGLFVLTVVGYLVAWCLKPTDGWRIYWKQIAKRAALLALLCAPFNINGNVVTVLGNAKSEKNIFSLCSLYQEAKGSAVTAIGVSGYQKAGQEVLTFIGVSGYQKAGENALTVVGVSGYQRADNSTFAPFALFQRVKEKSRLFALLSKLKAD